MSLGTRNIKQIVRSRELLVLAVLAFAVLALLPHGKPGPFVSSEVRFADVSPSGLAIVPASCPSSPHSTSDCKPPTVTTRSANNITATNARLRGEARPNGYATTGWFRYYTVNPGTCSDISGTRAPSSGGSSLGSGNSFKDYNYDLSGLSPDTTYYYCAIAENSAGKGYGEIVSFTTVGPPGVTISQDKAFTNPGEGFKINYGRSGGGSATSCTLQRQSPSESSPTTIHTNSGGNSGVNQTLSSPLGTWMYRAQCTGSGGTSNWVSLLHTVDTGSPQCTPQYYCSGNNLNYLTNQCVNQFVQTCLYGCFNGICLLPPAVSFVSFTTTGFPVFEATGHLQVTPSLISSGGTARVYWNVENAESCTVTGTNGDMWTGKFSGAEGKATGPITEQTVYTLQCTGLPEATPPTVTEARAVNVTPVFQEL